MKKYSIFYLSTFFLVASLQASAPTPGKERALESQKKVIALHDPTQFPSLRGAALPQLKKITPLLMARIACYQLFPLQYHLL